MSRHRSYSRKDSYRRLIQRPLNSLVFVVPLLLIYHVGAALLEKLYAVRPSLLVPRYMEWFLINFGGPRQVLLPLLIVSVLLFQHVIRKDPWKIHGWVLAGTVVESVALTLPLVIVASVTGLVSVMFAQVSQPASPQTGVLLITSVGAGLYEEFVFRLVFIALFLLVVVDVAGMRRGLSDVLAVISSAVLFALCHFTWAQIGGGAAFDWARFLFLLLAGVIWGTMFLYHGFAVAVGSHIVWDIYATLVHGAG